MFDRLKKLAQDARDAIRVRPKIIPDEQRDAAVAAALEILLPEIEAALVKNEPKIEAALIALKIPPALADLIIAGMFKKLAELQEKPEPPVPA